MVKLKPNMHDLDALSRFIAEANKLTTWESKKIVRDVAKHTAFACYRYTPIAPTHSAWATVTLRSGERVDRRLPHYLYGRNQISQRRILGRGYAKSGWLPACRHFGGGQPGYTQQEGGFVDRTTDAQAPKFQGWNSVPFIDALDRGGAVPHLPGRSPDVVQPAHILTRAIHQSARILEDQLKRYTRRMVLAWGKKRVA